MKKCWKTDKKPECKTFLINYIHMTAFLSENAAWNWLKRLEGFLDLTKV